MSKYSKITSFITLAILSANTMSTPVLAIDELQKKPSNSEEKVTESNSEIELPDVQTIIEETEESSDEVSEIRSSDVQEESVVESNTIKESVEKNEIKGQKETPKKEKTEKVKKKAKKQVRDDEEGVQVSDWSDFVAKLADASVTKITLSADLKATSKATANHDIIIEGNDKTIDFQKQTIAITSGKVTIGNVNLSSTATTEATAMFTGTGNLEFTGNVTRATTNAAPTVNMPNGTVEMTDATVSMSGGSLATIIAKTFLTNGGTINNTAPMFYRTATASSKFESIGTEWNLNLNDTSALATAMWTLGGTADVHFDSTSKLNLNIALTSTKSDYKIFDMQKKGTILMEAPMNGVTSMSKVYQVATSGSSLAIAGQASKSRISGAKDSFFKATTTGVNFTVKDGADIEFEMDGEKNSSAHALWSLKGDLTTSLEGKSKLNIQKKAGSAVAVLMQLTKNDISVTGGSDLIVFNEGNGTPADEVKSVNHAIMYLGTVNSQVGNFNIKDENSSVDITANSGSAITTAYTRNTVDAGPGTYFIARGKPQYDSGIIRSFQLTFKMDGLKYFDFKHMGGGYTLNANTLGTGSTFEMANSDLSVWDLNMNTNGDPKATFESLSFKSKGYKFQTWQSGNSDAFKKELVRTASGANGLRKYSRITGNNQTPSVHEVRVPTDADNRVFARATVPEGKFDEPRGVYENEVTLTMQELDPEGNVVQTGEGKAKPGDFVPYVEDGETVTTGTVEVKFDKFLTKGNTVKVISGYRGATNDAAHVIPAEDINGEDTVRDITPPETVATIQNKDSISVNTPSVKGNVKEGKYATLYTADHSKNSGAVEIDAEGNFELPMIPGLEEDDMVYVSIKDDAGKQVGILNPPTTNDDQGNEQPIGNFKYHDRDFVPAADIKLVGGEITLESAPTSLDFGENEIARSDLNLKPIFDKDLIVTDTRVVGLREEWALTLKVTKPFVNAQGDWDLTPGLSYTNSSKNQQELSESDIIVEQMKHENEEQLNLSKNWKTDEGFNLNVPTDKQKVDEFSGELGWTLQKSVPNREV